MLRLFDPDPYDISYDWFDPQRLRWPIEDRHHGRLISDIALLDPRHLEAMRRRLMRDCDDLFPNLILAIEIALDIGS